MNVKANANGLGRSRILAMRSAVLAIFAFGFVGVGHAQASPDLSFETASIRPMEPSAGCASVLPPGSVHFSLVCFTLRQIIGVAWGVGDADNIEGGDASALSAYYAIRATTPGDKPWVFDEARQMLRQLLQERFHLALHTSTRRESGYGLFVAKSGAKLKAAEYSVARDGTTAGAPSTNTITSTHIKGRQAKMIVITTLISHLVRAPVVDRTGVTGIFDVDVDFAPMDGTESPFPDFFSALESQLGLQLKSEKVDVPILLIDHVDAAPTPN